MMHAELPITGGHVLMATDMLRSMGQQTRIGTNTTLCLDVGSRQEADRLYGACNAVPACDTTPRPSALTLTLRALPLRFTPGVPSCQRITDLSPVRFP